MNNHAITHGLEGEWVTPDWPPLTLEFARRLLAQYSQAGSPLGLASVSPRPFSSASVVTTDHDPIFVKRHSAEVRTLAGLHEEHLFMRHLREGGVSVPLVLAADNSATAVALEDDFGLWSCEVQTVPAGVDLYRDALSWTPFHSVSHAYSAGQALAHFHQAARTYAAPARSLQMLLGSFTLFAGLDSAAALNNYLSLRPQLSEFVRRSNSTQQALELLAPFHRELIPLLGDLTPLWTHNDLHASNLLWSSERPTAEATAILDFGLADRTTAVYDIAFAIERNIVEWLKLPTVIDHATNIPVHLDALNALLNGYQSVRRLTPAESIALAPMTALCCAEFALSEADYFLGALHSEKRASLAIDGYLLRHAQWFRSPEGEHLVEAIRRAVTSTNLRAPDPSHKGKQS